LFHIKRFFLSTKDNSLQDAQRSACEEMIKILSNSSKAMKKWKNKWYQSCVDNRDDATTLNETMWGLFAAAISAVDSTIEGMNHSIQGLTQTLDSIPKLDKDQSLESKMNQARFNVDELTKKINELEGKKRKLKRKLNQLEQKSPSNTIESSDCQTPLDVLTERHEEMKELIHEKKKALQRAERSFQKQQAKLFDESKKYESERCVLLKKQSNDFVESLNIKNDEFDELLESCDPEKELIQWEEKTFHRRNKQFGKSQPTKNVSPD